ncbi:MAG: UDP-N-acetylglucosamine O-acyltransferase [Xanthomonadales bacterium]|nr:UDP-N-acetylglucosamine O-acyltransferase [Xanthomonadales bacterium]
MTNIHPTALVDPAAKVADDVEIGAFTLVGPKVTIGPGSWIGPHVVLTGRTTIGRNARIFQFASIGEEPQDKKYAGEDTELIIGDNNTIRELCTFSRGTIQGGGKTIIGNNNWIMACVHIAHDCILGDNIIMAKNQSIPPYVTVSGEKAKAKGVNTEGLRRRGFTPEQVQQVRRAYKVLYRSGLPLEEARAKLTEMAETHEEIKPLVAFLAATEKSFIR